LEIGYDIFVHVPERLLNQWKNLLTLMVSQFFTHFEKREEKNAVPVLFMLDEFLRLGKMEGIVDGLATLRSKKITMLDSAKPCAVRFDLQQGNTTSHCRHLLI
jgi:type IV secretion system protein VirD4